MRFLKADRLFNGQFFLPADRVLVISGSGLLQDIVPENLVDAEKIEKLEGTITPGFVNSHCHLELSHLYEKIAQHTGLPEFAKQVIIQRAAFKKEEIAEHLEDADLAMWRNGTVAVGDISNGEDSFEQKLSSKIFYHTFIELIGLNPANAGAVFEKGVSLFEKLRQYGLPGSLAPHAPYSTSLQLIKKISEYNAAQHLPFSIHNQESNAETKFFMGEKSGFDNLYAFLKLDVSWFKAPYTSSLKNYAGALLASPSVLVHNCVTTAADIEQASSKNIYWCFCPGANLYIENRLPAFDLFTSLKNKICIGTDSLASNGQLDLVKEANLILSSSNLFSVKDILSALTIQGAEALGIGDRYGRFHIGKNAGLNLVEHQNSQLRFIKKII